MGGLAAKLDEVTAEIPMKEAVRYKKGNLKWTRSDVKKHSEALSCGLLELGCKVRLQRDNLQVHVREPFRPTMIMMISSRVFWLGGMLPTFGVYEKLLPFLNTKNLGIVVRSYPILARYCIEYVIRSYLPLLNI